LRAGGWPRERAKGLRANELEANRHFLKPYVVGLLNSIVAVKNHLPRKRDYIYGAYAVVSF
jgi:hypothetical protein